MQYFALQSSQLKNAVLAAPHVTSFQASTSAWCCLLHQGTFFSFTPQQLAFSSQQPSVPANGWSQWRQKILCNRILSTLDTCQASKQINQSSDIENVQQTITAADAVKQTCKIPRVNFPMTKWEKNRLMLLWSLQWNGVLQAMQEHFFADILSIKLNKVEKSEQNEDCLKNS